MARYIAIKIVVDEGLSLLLDDLAGSVTKNSHRLAARSTTLDRGLKVDSTFDDFVAYHALGWTVI